MKNKVLLISMMSALLIIGGCNNAKSQENGNLTQTGNNNKIQYTNFYQISGNNTINLSLYGNVVSSNIKNITSTRAGKISSLSCQPGTTVNPSTVIATITPDLNDPNLQNTQTQRMFINDQIRTLEDTIGSTDANFVTQINQLRSQKDNNNNQIKILNSNLEILNKQKNVSTDDIGVQTANIQEQLKILNDQKVLLADNKEKDLNKINVGIDNQRKQINNYISNYMESVDQVFGITEKNRAKNDAYETFLSSKNTVLKQRVENEFQNISTKLSKYSSLSNDDVSSYIDETSNFLRDAAESINNSSTSTTFTQSSIDTYYSTFINASNSLLTLKTNLDNSIKSVDTTKNTYDNQISTLQANIESNTKNLENLKTNKTSSSNLSIDNSINTINGQIATLQTTNSNLDKQIDGLNQQKAIQLNQIRNQISNLKQNLSTLGNNLNGETLVAGVSGTIKEKKVDLDNKISASTLICTISPNTSNSLKIQIYSTQKLNVGQEYVYMKDGVEIGSGKINFELPYIDTATQNYIYETNISGGKLNEGDKLDIKLNKKEEKFTVNIPLEYIVPKLEGYYINKCSNTDCSEVQEQKISVGSINNGYIEVLSGVNKGDKLAK